MYNNSCLYVKSNVLGTDGPTYLGKRWSHSREKSSLNILDTDGPTWVKKSSLNILGTNGPTWVKTDNKQKRTSQTKIYIRKSKQLRKRGKTTNWHNNLSMHTKSCLCVKSYVLGTDGPTWVKHHPKVSRAQIVHSREKNQL